MSEDLHNPHVYPSGPSDTALGITLRDYYAGEAPWDIPSWFTPVGIPAEPSVPLNPELYFNDPTNNAATFQPLYIYYTRSTNTWNDADYKLQVTDGVIPESLKSQVSIYWGAYDYALALHNEWELHKEKETYFQWRFYFSDEMLNKRLGNNES